MELHETEPRFIPLLPLNTPPNVVGGFFLQSIVPFAWAGSIPQESHVMAQHLLNIIQGNSQFSSFLM